MTPRIRAALTAAAITLAVSLAATAGAALAAPSAAAEPSAADCATALTYPDRTEAERAWLELCVSALRPYTAPTPTATATATPTAEPTTPPATPTPSATPTPTATPPLPQATDTYTVQGRYLVDPLGAQVVVRGVEQTFWSAGWLPNSFVNEIGRTGANTVRILPKYTLNTPTGEPRSTLAQILDQIQRGIASHMLVDVAIDGGRLSTWLRPEVKAMLMPYQNRIVIHAKGEATEGTAAAWAAASINTITQMRAAGYTAPLYIMSNTYGRNLPTLVSHGQQVADADPLHRIVFGLQLYWGTGNTYQNAYGYTITSAIDKVATLNYPVQLGIIYRSDPQDNSPQTTPLSTIMAKAQEHHIGWLYWDWRMGVSDMTYDGIYGHWAGAECPNPPAPCVPGWPIGLTVAVTDPNSIQHTSNRTPYMNNNIL